jgi:hypothetical protein
LALGQTQALYIYFWTGIIFVAFPVKKAMDQQEKRFKHMEGLEKWFVKKSPLPIEIME